MTTIATPAWCRWRLGRSAILIVAPHGGRRPPLPDRRDAHPTHADAYTRKVNDLHTADLAEELAETLAAGFIVNPEVDRNQLDLNRVSQVAARAPWFLELVEALLDDILARHACAEVLFVHGWNVVQPKCDIGIGHALADAAAAHLHAAALTISPDYAASRLHDLRARCAQLGIATAFGERYAARHPNNCLQLFRAVAGNGAASPRLNAWAGARRVQAVQLELGVPLRWPGPYRDAFVRAMGGVFGEGDGGTTRAATSASGEPQRVLPAAPRVEPYPALLAPPQSLQLYDSGSDIGLSARIDRAGPRGASGRVLLLLGGNRVALFLGEEPHGTTLASDGPYFMPAPDGFRLRFSGPALAADDGSLYVDLEQAFAASRLCSVTVEIDFRRGLSADFGPASGWIAVDGVRRTIAAPAFARHGVLQRSAGAWSSQVVLSAAFGAQRALRVHYEFPGRGGVLHELTAHGEREQALAQLTLRFGPDRYTPEQLRIGERDPLVCRPLSRMAITRPLAAHRHARVTFGAARFTRDGAEGFGFYEYARALV